MILMRNKHQVNFSQAAPINGNQVITEEPELNQDELRSRGKYGSKTTYRSKLREQ